MIKPQYIFSKSDEMKLEQNNDEWTHTKEDQEEPEKYNRAKKKRNITI